MSAPTHLKALLGRYPVTAALRDGALRSDVLHLDFADVSVPNTAFKRTVRDLEFDVSELAIVTFLMAKAYGKPLVLLPAVVLGRFQHPFLVYNPMRGPLTPAALEGRRVGVRSYSVTTVMWIRGILMHQYGVDMNKVHWVTFEDGHVAEYRDPPAVERAPTDKEMVAMLLAGELDAAVLGGPIPAGTPLARLIPNPDDMATQWRAATGAMQVNHMVVVKEAVARENPDAIRALWHLLVEAKRAAGPIGPGELDLHPFGVDANRRNLEIAIEYVYEQRLIPRRFTVDELFDDTTRTLNP